MTATTSTDSTTHCSVNFVVTYITSVLRSFTGAGIADTGSGYVENCWISTSSTDAKTSKPVFGNPNRGSGYQLVNCYYQEEADATNKYTNHSGTYGIPTRKNSQAFYNGEVAYDLNGFYLFKRYNDHETASGIDYKYYAINEDGTLTEPKTKTTAAVLIIAHRVLTTYILRAVMSRTVMAMVTIVMPTV